MINLSGVHVPVVFPGPGGVLEPRQDLGLFQPEAFRVVYRAIIHLLILLNGAGLRELVFGSYFYANGWDPIDGALLGLIFTGTQTLVSLFGAFPFYRIMTSFQALAAPSEANPPSH